MSILSERIIAYLNDAPVGGAHSDAAGANAYELLEEAVEELETVKRLMTALEQCAAPYSTPPGTGRRGQEWVNAEFQRRMDLAHSALNPVPRC